MSSFGRALGVLRTGSLLLRRRGTQQITTRNGSDGPAYRGYPHITKRQVFHSELISGAMWFWILWHFWHDPDLVFGHFPWPDPSQWTDEELSIPPDDEDVE
ncbi:NADH dehydrogenase [ubiquinone] 1 beta subcomplex subunit 2, mitochondrial [Centropristis striata]|uniref:NADH dehydrogenase [ubiquinone] 1 beta subcomplex subunit 2, mitochondrial n=1 Tax=Centropristis striata TaxID=184440 RepID=UPI0027DEE67C|nr:NADH dehydrogenase [ubiquinone] 1 beta subcomplex subunit 2, mitochondrial [Centropristis striata]